MDFEKLLEPLGGKKKFITLCIIIGVVFVMFGGCTALVRHSSKKSNTTETSIPATSEVESVAESATESET